MIPLGHYLVVSAVLFAIGAAGVFLRRNLITILLSIEIMLNAPQEDAAEWDRMHPLRRPGMARFGTMLAGLLIVQLVWGLLRVTETSAAVGARGDVADISSVRSVGRVLFTDYMFAFESTSVLILVGIVGGLLMAGREGDR